MSHYHGIGISHARGGLARLPQGLVGVVLGLVLTVTQGQSAANPFCQVTVVPLVPPVPIHDDSLFSVSATFASSFFLPGVGRDRAQTLGQGGGSAAAGPREAQWVPAAFTFHFSGHCSQGVTCEVRDKASGTPDLLGQGAVRGASSASVAPIAVRLHGESVSGDAVLFARREETGHAPTLLRRSGRLDSVFSQGPAPGAPGEAVLTVPHVPLPVHQSVHGRLHREAATHATGPGGMGRGGADAGADFAHTLRFPPGGPVFDLPSGSTVHAGEGLIQDNQGVPGAAPVPEPSTYLLFATGLLGLLGYGWRRKKPRACGARLPVR